MGKIQSPISQYPQFVKTSLVFAMSDGQSKVSDCKISRNIEHIREDLLDCHLKVLLKIDIDIDTIIKNDKKVS